MRSPPRRPLSTLVAALAIAAVVPAAAQDRESPRVALFEIGEGPLQKAASAGVRDGLRLAELEPTLDLVVAPGDEAREALAELAFEPLDVVIAVGPRAAMALRDARRANPIVFTGVRHPEALELPGRSTVCGTAGGVDIDEVLRTVRRAAPRARTFEILYRADDTEGAWFAERLATAAEDSPLTVTTIECSPYDRTGLVAIDGVSVGGAQQEADVVLMTGGFSPRQVETMAECMAADGHALIGSRRDHLLAGCGVVIRTDARRLGTHAIALARRVLDGEAPSEIGVHRPRRRLVEVNLDAARRLGWEIPLPVVAGADHVIPALGGRR